MNRREIGSRALVILLLDADGDLPCVLAPQLLKAMTVGAPDIEKSCVLAKPEFETWFVASAESLSELLDLEGLSGHEMQPEVTGQRKAWIDQRMKRGGYSPTVDQPKMTARIDLVRCRERSPSFDKLCRDLQRWVGSS